MKKIIAFVLCICTLSTLLLTGCGSLKEKEQIFVDLYTECAMEYFENPETVVINEITEYADTLGGTMVVFSYEHTTDVGYKETGTLSMVTSDITLDASLVTIPSGLDAFGYWLTEHNGKTVAIGYVDDVDSLPGDLGEIVFLWKNCQAKETRTNYNLNRINDALTGNKPTKKSSGLLGLIDKLF